MKKLYCFDFDGTLTYKDTMFMYLKFYDSTKYRIQFLKHVPLFILLKLKLAETEKVKKSFIGSILKGQTQEKIEMKSKQFFEHHYPQIVRENALDFIKNIDRNNIQSLLVTASLDIWVKPFAEELKMQLVSTRAEFKNGVFTGNFIGKNCNGKEKLVRIKEEINDSRYDKIIAFGDTSGDRPMLKWANEGHYQFFH
ncbi:HAD-IB family hydrolase [Chryseobacterium sp. WG14]|jgi:HAD superfamily hydrolase (TIGR01490 family)|uniref:HAD superfamily hydrolase (TIGR01490 family) n=1 Tax=Chryseobacterium rhizosphaerae TaxID=395937 RepID=A0AAE3YAK9_9FLAO|nr:MULTISPECIES: HAD-IB family hydrolase [Chryseobacterium]MBL3550166.1 HAD-IB family hydrolase [Chryseobacterium sp. KMC2]MCQ9635735.1 HAD-IB family hydrolase [Chryseobacterium sp. WG23]MCQ9637869.1 HAD-IB family hydrolase [Chryseobacterium sp. WG14]MDC8099243.1 HAD-IB family hydrolase [Chryseobacterium rhizosphaerae]MDR6527965.1 HAD superfamily hydrolase (TIGR01490 family) [Chryseobacterium rhizosphaerae]